MAHPVQTAEQLLLAGDIGRCELIRGELAKMLPTGGQHGQVAMRIGSALDDFVSRHGLGRVLAAETGFVLSRDPEAQEQLVGGLDGMSHDVALYSIPSRRNWVARDAT